MKIDPALVQVEAGDVHLPQGVLVLEPPGPEIVQLVIEAGHKGVLVGRLQGRAHRTSHRDDPLYVFIRYVDVLVVELKIEAGIIQGPRLVQPVPADFQFGSGDFHVMGLAHRLQEHRIEGKLGGRRRPGKAKTCRQEAEREKDPGF